MKPYKVLLLINSSRMSVFAPLLNISLSDAVEWQINGECSRGAISIYPTIDECISFNMPLVLVTKDISFLSVIVMSISNGLMGSFNIIKDEEAPTLVYTVTIKKPSIDILNYIWSDYKEVCNRLDSLLKNYKNEEMFNLANLDTMVEE